MEKILIFESKTEAEKVIQLNQIRKLRIKGQYYCITQTTEGFILFDQECPHSGHDLSEGAINGFMEIVCPSHAYRFHLKTGECNRPCAELKIYRTCWDDGKLFAIF